MIDFHTTAIELQSAIYKTKVLLGLTIRPSYFLQVILRVLQENEQRLYGDDVSKVDYVASVELQTLYWRTIRNVFLCNVFIDYLCCQLGISVGDVELPRDKTVLTIKDSKVVETLPSEIGPLVIFKLQHVEDVLRQLIRDGIITNNAMIITRYIDNNYQDVLNLLTDFLSFQGQPIAKNVSWLWNNGYYATHRLHIYPKSYFELIVPQLVTLQIPLRY